MRKIKRKNIVLFAIIFLVCVMFVCIYFFFIDTRHLKADVEESIYLNGEWLLNSKNENGFLKYGYYPKENKEAADNNFVRQIATLWAVAKMHNYTEDERYKLLSNHGMEHINKHIKDSTDFKYISYQDRSKLAYSAFAILALLEMDDYPERDPYLKGFAEGILSQQNEDGSFRTYFFSDDISYAINYYPGEAMLALMKLYQYDQDERYLAAVEKGFYFYRDYWRSHKHISFISWHTQAYFLLYNATEKQEYADFVFEMNDWFIADKFGFLIPSFLEGTNDAYKLAEMLDDECHMKKYNRVILIGTRLVVMSQYKDAEKYNNDRIIGGCYSNWFTKKLRIDYNQHALFALIKADEGVLADSVK